MEPVLAITGVTLADSEFSQADLDLLGPTLLPRGAMLRAPWGRLGAILEPAWSHFGHTGLA